MLPLFQRTIVRTIFLLLVFSAFCPACIQECCQFACEPSYNDGRISDNDCRTTEVCSVKECKQAVEDKCGKPAAETRWRKLDNRFEDVDWDVYAPWDISDGNCFCAKKVGSLCAEGL